MEEKEEKKEAVVQVTAALPAELVERLDAKAKQNERSRAKEIKKRLADSLDAEEK